MKKLTVIAGALLVLAALYFSRIYNFLLFHTLAEVFSIIIACGIFMVAWNCRRMLDNQYLLFIGIAYLFIGVLDLAHAFAYKGMPILPGYDANAPTQLWIAARYLQSATLLAAPLTFRRRIHPGFYLLIYGLLVMLLLLAILYWRIFPDCFLPEAGGLTPFKKSSEHIICLLLAVSGILILQCRRRFDPGVLRWMLGSVVLTIMSELAFTAYVSVYGAANMFGHFFKIVAFYCVYKAIIETGLTSPYNVLFRDLKTSKEHYRSLFVHMTNGFANHRMKFDRAGSPVDYKFLEVNEAFERLTGLTGVVGRWVTEVIPGIENDPADWIGAYGRVAATGDSIQFESYSEYLKKWYSITAYCPSPGQFTTVFEDITERRISQEALRASEARFKLLSDTAGRLLATEDPQGLVNTLCCEVMSHLECQVFFNYLVDEATGRFRLNAFAGLPGAEARKVEWQDFGSIVCGSAERDRHRVVAEDILNLGDERMALIKSYGIQAYCCHALNVQGCLIGTLSFGTTTRTHFTPEEVGLMRTVADQVALAMQRISNQQALRDINKALEDKVRERTATLEHLVDTLEAEINLRQKAEDELRQANLQLTERADQLRTVTAELTMAEQRERKRLSKVLHDGLQQHLAIAKMQIGSLSSRRDDGELKKAMGEIEAMIGESIQISRSLSADLSPPVLYEGGLAAGLEWLAGWMRQKHAFDVDLIAAPVDELAEDVKILVFESVRELLFNAVKHAQAPCAQVRLEQMAGPGTRITVSDRGRGFDISRLKTMGKSGEGFGLFSIRERIDLIGGLFEIDSAPGKGSRFVLTVPHGRSSCLPVCINSPAAAGSNCGIGTTAVQCLDKSIRVLIVDDHALFRDGVARLVKKQPDIDVVGQAEDGREAIELAGALRPDVILMDINMPGINGIEASRRIHQALPRIRILGLSMHEDQDHEQAMLAAGAVEFKHKGCSAAELISAIRLCAAMEAGSVRAPSEEENS